MDSLEVSLEFTDDKAEVVIGRNKQRLRDFARDAEKIQPQIKFKIPNENYIDLDKLQKRADETRKTFEGIAKTRIDSGQINSLTKDIVRAVERSRQLESDISSIKKELASPNRKSSIAFLTEELRTAEKEADQLTRKLSALPGGAGASGGAGRSPGNLRLSSFQKTNLSYQLNDVATMAAMGADPVRILASQGGQIAQIFSAEQITAFTAAYSSLLPILGAGAAAIALTYKITSDIRDSAERRLKTEEKIASILNKQRLEAQELKKAFEDQRKEAAEARRFQAYQQDTPIEQIRSRLELLNRLEKMTANEKPNEQQLKAYRQEILALEAQTANFDRQQEITRKTSPDNAFDQNWENYKKNQEAMEKASQKAALEFAKSVEQGKAKVKELGRNVESVFDGLYLRANSNNPFVTLFSEADKSLKILHENTKGLSKDLISTFEQMEAKANNLKLFETRLNNNLSVFDLRDAASNFRNPFQQKSAEDNKKEQERLIARYLEQNPNFLYLQGKTQVDEETRLKILNSSALGRSTLVQENPFQALQDRLDKQISIIYGGRLNQDELGLADRKLISLTGGLNPNELTQREREAAALAREREADRLEKSETQAKLQREKGLAVQEQIRDEIKKLNAIAEKEGLKGITSLIEIVDKTNGGANVLGASPKPADMLGGILGFN